MRAFGALGGAVGPNHKRKMDALLAVLRAEARLKRRAEIAALSNRDMRVLMAEVIVAAIESRGAVTLTDFDQAGLPRHRIEANKAPAMALARRMQPRLDAMLATPGAA